LGRDTRRYSFENDAEIIDLGLRLVDVRNLELETSAEATFDRGTDFAKRQNLRLNGATNEEIEFLLRQRVELNALPSDQLVAFIEAKLSEHGVKKVVPNLDLLGDAYRLFVNGARLEKIVEKAIEDMEHRDAPKPPGDLGERVAAYLKQHPEMRWDAAVAQISEEDASG
jgi:hypothetical protein